MKKTCLYDEHLKHGAKMVEFAGFFMPIEYTNIPLEHQAVRNRSGLFDVSHMGEIEIKGSEANAFLNYLVTNDITKVKPNRMIYALMLYEDGGIVDDLMIYKYNDEHYLLVVNASNKDKDFEWINKNNGNYNVQIRDLSDEIAQLALQGPLAKEVLQKFTIFNLDSLKLFDFVNLRIFDKDFLVSRSGYTGEDGFEIYGSNDSIVELFKELVTIPSVSLCGLGARDTLRFEAAMPLYGHEIDKDINPLEAGLDFAVKFTKDFIGKEALLKVKNEGLKRKVVGLELLERGIARNGYEVFYNDEKIGYVTTGYMIPNTDKSLALALIDINYTNLDTQVYVQIRKNKVLAKVREKNFLKKKYVR